MEQNTQPLNPEAIKEQQAREQAEQFMKDAKEFAREHKADYENEVKVLESITRAKSFSIIPMAVHNLAVICPERTHVYLQPIRDLFASIDLRNPQFEKIKEATKETIKNLDMLIRQEKTAYRNQANMLITQRRKEGRPWNLKEEAKYFEHVVYDPSMMLHEFFTLPMQGVILDEEQQKIIGQIYDIVHKDAEELLALRKTAVKNCEELIK